MQSGDQSEATAPLSMEQRLEALRADVINGTWAFAIDRSLDGDSSELAFHLRRCSQHAGFSALFRILDKHSDSTSFPKFLNALEQTQQSSGRSDEIKQTLADDRGWLEANRELIAELRDFRDRHIAHLDKSAAKDVYAGKPIRFDPENILAPTLVERADRAVSEVSNMVARYRRILLDDQADVVAWRNHVIAEVGRSMRLRLQQ